MQLPSIVMMEYDHFCRFIWSDRSRQNVDGFDVNVSCLGLDKDLRDQAEANVARRLVVNNKNKGSKVFSTIITCHELFARLVRALARAMRSLSPKEW